MALHRHPVSSVTTERSISDRLRDKGIGHIRMDNGHNGHLLYCLESGEPLGWFTADRAVKSFLSGADRGLDPITTEYVHPPIPLRQFDWAAYRDPEGLTGQGATEAEAIADLLEQEGDA